MRNKLKSTACLLLVVLLIVGCMGCDKEDAGGLEVVFTTGLSGDEVFKIGDEVCTISEANLWLMTLQKQYEKIFGKDNWEQDFGKDTLGNYLKQQVITQLSQIKSMNLMAQKQDVTLTDEELQQIRAAAEEHAAAFAPGQFNELNIKESDIEKLYEQYAISEKLYQELIRDVPIEISDDEARIIWVQHILLKTSREDENGNRVSLTGEERSAVNERAYQAWERAQVGESFESLATEYTEDTTIQNSFGRGEMPEAFEEAAFNLANGQISGLVETEYGIHIIKCLSNYEQSETDANKIVIYEGRCVEQLNEKYDAFMKNIPVEFNEKLWNKFEIKKSEGIPEVDFLEIYASVSQ